MYMLIRVQQGQLNVLSKAKGLSAIDEEVNKLRLELTRCGYEFEEDEDVAGQIWILTNVNDTKRFYGYYAVVKFIAL